MNTNDYMASTTAEESLLGAMLIRPEEAVPAALVLCEADDLYSPENKRIFRAMKELASSGGAIDATTVALKLAERGELGGVGGGAYLVHLMNECPAPRNAAEYARIVKDQAWRRSLARGVEEASRSVHNAEDLLTHAEEIARILSAQPAGDGRSRVKSGARFVLDEGAEDVAIWGSGDRLLWAQGQSLFLTGPPGVGKTTITLQLLAGRLGLEPEVLGYPVAPADGLVAYFAMDRPAQIRRAMRRLFKDEHRELLDQKLIVWHGPPDQDLGRNPEWLVNVMRSYGAKTAFLDSAKDAAVKLSDDEVGGTFNRAIQLALADGREVVVLHHVRKGDGKGHGRPKGLDEIYGSTWLTSGAGSVILLWGPPGADVVELHHLKPIVELVDPMTISHHHATGRSSVIHDSADALELLRAATNGLTATELAIFQVQSSEITDSQRKHAKRLLDSLVAEGLARRVRGARGGSGGTTPDRYYASTGTTLQLVS